MVTIMAKRKQGLTKKQKALLREVAKDPEASNYEINKTLNKLDVVKSNNYTGQLISNNSEIAAKVAILREKYELKVVKQFPKANKVVNTHLKDNNLDAAKLVYRHALPIMDESKRPIPQQTVNVQAIQTLIYNELKQEDNEAIDVTSSDSNE